MSLRTRQDTRMASGNSYGGQEAVDGGFQNDSIKLLNLSPSSGCPVGNRRKSRSLGFRVEGVTCLSAGCDMRQT